MSDRGYQGGDRGDRGDRGGYGGGRGGGDRGDRGGYGGGDRGYGGGDRGGYGGGDRGGYGRGGDRGGRGGGDRGGRGGFGGGRGRGFEVPTPKPGAPPVTVKLMTNFFRVRYPETTIHLYRIDYVDPVIPDDRLTKGKAIFIYQLLLTTGKLKELGLGFTVFDGKYGVYAQNDIGEVAKKVTIELETQVEKEKNAERVAAGGKERRVRKQSVQFKRVKTVKIFTQEMTDNTIQSLELQIMHILTHKNPEQFMKKARSIYELEKAEPVPDTDMSIIPGYYHQLSMSQIGPVLCSDVTFMAGLTKMTLLQYIMIRIGSIMGSRSRFTLDEFFRNNKMNNVRNALAKELAGKQIKLDHLNGGRSKKITRLSSGTPNSKVFEQEDKATGKKTKVSVAEYFLRTYKRRLDYPDVYPMIVIKRPGGQEDYYPLDVCSIVAYQPKGNMTGEERSYVINATRKELDNRFREIMKHAEQLSDTLNSSAKAKDINFLQIEMERTPIQIEGRVIAPPLIYYGKRNDRPVTVEPRQGSWNIQDTPLFTPKKPIDLLTLAHSRIGDGPVHSFVEELERVAKNSAVIFNTSALQIYGNDRNDPDHIQIRKLVEEEKSRKKNLFVVVMLDGKESMKYNLIKNELDLICQVSSQCVVKRNVEKNNGSLLGNIVNAINVKASDPNGFGVNATVDLPLLKSKPTTVIGIDVYHAPPGSSRPSEASISASINATATRYYSTARSQKSRIEGISEIRSMFDEVLAEALIQLKGTPFHQFVMIRDGVAETQFIDICQAEIKALQDAISANKAYDGRQVQILYMIAQKRNITRLAVPHDGAFHTPPAGTVLDNTITGRNKHDFYILPHKAIIGSAKPIHYHVVRNDMKLPITDIEDFVFKLCHLHPGCTRSVSLPAPLYNAHKLGYRIGQVYRPAMEQFDDNKSESSGGSGGNGYHYENIQIPYHLKYTPFYL